MKDLIAKLEAATEGSRELDGLIWPIADHAAWELRCCFKGMKYAGRVHTKAEKVAHEKRAAEYAAPHYTTSLDAALSLLPASSPEQAVFWRVGNDGEGGNPADFKSEVVFARDLTHSRGVSVAETGPLALASAILRARVGVGEGE